MIRPKHPSFEYTEDEINTMIDDIEFCKRVGLDGVVFGCLNENSNFHIDQINRLSKISKPLNVIIHKSNLPHNSILLAPFFSAFKASSNESTQTSLTICI